MVIIKSISRVHKVQMTEAEMDKHLGFRKSERSDNDDYRKPFCKNLKTIYQAATEEIFIKTVFSLKYF